MGIFARVLEEILVAHQEDDFSDLGGQGAKSDPIWHPLRRLAIAPSVISRLKEAARSDERRATLNPDDLEYLMKQLRFDLEECTKLRTALLAQGVEIFLYDRLAEDENRGITRITSFIYNQLLGQLGPLGDTVRDFEIEEAPAKLSDESMRDFKTEEELDSERTIEIALSLADRVGAMMTAAITAKTRNDHRELRFWGRVITAGYQETIALLRPIDPASADRYEKTLARFQARLNE
jgi:hypothetical protein